MSGFKKSQPGLRFAAEKITPDEQDRYEVVSFANPGVSTSWFGTAAASGTSDVKAITLVNAISNYPRNVGFVMNGNGTALTVSGTVVVNGKDQFGSVITETIGATAGTGTATGVGTKVFANVTSGTVTYGTFTTTGTPQVGFVPGTNCLLGLPVKLGGTTDVVILSHNAGTGPVSVGGGTIAAFVNVPMSAVRPAATLTGTEVITAYVKSTFDPEGKIPTVSNFTQVT